MTGPVIIAARRTRVRSVRATGAAAAGQQRFDPVELAAPVLAALAGDVAPLGVDDVVLGAARGHGGDLARVAALAAGLGVAVPGVAVDRQCGSGLEAVRLAAALVGAGQASVVLAGGVDSASAAGPGRARFAPSPFPDPEMGEAAEVVAREREVSRQRQDAYAVRSHRLAAAARDAGRFADELVEVPGLSGDDRPRRHLDAAALARLPAAFVPGGTVTAGNSCGVSDGAAAVAVVDDATHARLGLPGLRVLASGVVGVDPARPGLGIVPAVRAVLDRAGRDLAEVRQIELTEAFAGQVLACTDELGLDPLGADADRICPDGGAIGLGHPWGASGAMLVVRLFGRFVREGDAPAGALGLAACAVGGGQGVALLVERVG